MQGLVGPLTPLVMLEVEEVEEGGIVPWFEYCSKVRYPIYLIVNKHEWLSWGSQSARTRPLGWRPRSNRLRCLVY